MEVSHFLSDGLAKEAVPEAPWLEVPLVLGVLSLDSTTPPKIALLLLAWRALFLVHSQKNTLFFNHVALADSSSRMHDVMSAKTMLG